MMRYQGKYIRIGIVDNDALALEALQYVVRTYLPQSEVIWKETDGNRAVSLCSTPATTPDALIVDASLENMTGSDVCRRIRANDAEIVLVGVTSFILARFHDAMLDSGAQCLLPKDKPQTICQAAIALCEGRIPLDARFSTESARSPPAPQQGTAGESNSYGHAVTARRGSHDMDRSGQDITLDRQTAQHLRIHHQNLCTAHLHKTGRAHKGRGDHRMAQQTERIRMCSLLPT